MQRRNGIAFYRPHTKQGWFHSLANYKYRYVRTGNRFGKSDMGAAEDCAFVLGHRPWLPDNHPDKYKGIPRKSTSGIILCADWKKAEEIFTNKELGTAQGKLFKFLPEDAIVRIKKDGPNIVKIVVKCIWGGYSAINIDTVVAWKQNNLRSESTSYDWIHVDEPVPKRMFHGYSRGLMDRDGKVWFTCTPISEPWINGFFRPHRRAPVYKDKPNIYGKDRAMIIGSSFDNPYNSEKGMEGFLAELEGDERMKKARLHGEPIENSGVIYSMYGDHHIYTGLPEPDRRIITPDDEALEAEAQDFNLWEAHNLPPKHWTYRYHLDCHPRTPHAVLFCATSPRDITYFYDELWMDVDYDTLAEQIKLCTKNRIVTNEWADPSAFNQQMDRKTTLAETFLEKGLLLEKAAKDPKRGIIETKQLLNTPGRLLFSDQLVHFNQEIDNYVWGDIEKRPDKPVDKDDHFMEGLYRLVLGGLTYIDEKVFQHQGRPDLGSYYSEL